MLSSLGGKQKGTRQVMPTNSLLWQELTPSHENCIDPSAERAPTTFSPTQTPAPLRVLTRGTKFPHELQRTSHGDSELSFRIAGLSELSLLPVSSPTPSLQVTIASMVRRLAGLPSSALPGTTGDVPVWKSPSVGSHRTGTQSDRHS